VTAPKIGDKVLAAINGTGIPKPATISGVITMPYGPSPQYFVHFDGSRGVSGPCEVWSIEEF